MLSKASFIKNGCYACKLLDNVDMHKYAKFDQNIPCGSRVKSIFTNCQRTDGGTDSHSDSRTANSRKSLLKYENCPGNCILQFSGHRSYFRIDFQTMLSVKSYSSHIMHNVTYEPRYEKTGFLHMRKQRRRSASQSL